MTGIRVRDLRDDLSFGSIVENLNWESLADEGVRAELNAIFEDRGVILFDGMEPSGKMHVAISKVFGPLKDHPTQSTSRVEGALEPGVIDMHSMPREIDGNYQGLVEVDGKLLARFSPWHYDHCYNDKLNRAGVLRALVNPANGGRTGFADGIDLYRSLSPDLRERIEGLNILYILDSRRSTMRFGRTVKVFDDSKMHAANVEEGRRFPRAIHPAVWTRRDGQKVLHISPWMAVGIEHHEDPEGDELLEAVCQEINRMAHAYWHEWKPTDMLIWDNWRLIHAVEGCDPKHERRTQRTTIEGDYGLGYFEGGKKVGEVLRDVA